ncbi:helix-turn-helix domain-containing protein [Tepidibacter sp. Z1-5]|uniref:helix-turn-helix domain-containing protein n=1 Tax=Tepidibacter sp. Z1-5 TaxID=3134138 RepID=UPI0030BDF167
MPFGDILKLLRENRGLTQQGLADVLGVGRATIAGYETKGKQPDYEKLKIIANYFNVTIDYLLGRTDNPKGYIEHEGNLHKDNTEYKAYDEIFQILRERLEEEGIVEKGQPVSKEIIEMLLKFGSEAAMEILKARNKEDM